ncbi:GNAT family N-acetyltransferase [Nocardioides sp.]|uniref:GNAT family N-acetyltransferase n=1 Tax=Nocardioides sp. TaxID=35761 RepID=UPI002717169B|nr:GNAT family N-acetyltransferase [Nocardioides sp.]MDO9457351.1 GNAT family N-acetyltransferase [Nocardioides sp.]
MSSPRLATPDDAERLVDLHHACWREAYTGLLSDETIEGVFADRPAAVAGRRERLADRTRPTWITEVDGEPVGFATAGPARYDDAPVPLELYAIYARASVWGTGIGHALLAASVGERAAYLWVLDGNDRATGFYRRHGFELDGATEDHPEGLHLRMVRSERAH